MPSTPTSPPDTDPRDRIFAVGTDQSDLNRKAGGSSIIVLATSLLKVVMQLGSIALLARLIPPRDYAVFIMAIPAIDLAVALGNFGLPQAIIQRKTITHAQASLLFWANTGFATIAAAAVLLLAIPAAHWYGDPRITPVFQIAAISVFLSVMVGPYVAIMHRSLRIKTLESCVITAELISVIIAVFCAFVGFSYWALVAQNVALPLITITLLMWVTGWRPSRLPRVGLGAQIRDIKGALHFGGFVAGGSVLTRFSQQLGTVVVGATQGAVATALFNRAFNLALLPQRRVMMPLSSVFTPSLSRLQEAPDEQRALFARFVSRIHLILLPISIVIASGPDWVIAIILGPQWLDAAPLLFWASLFTMGAGLRGAFMNLFHACGQSKPMFWVSLIRLGIASAALFGTAGYGIEVMIAAYMLSELFVMLPLTAVVAQRVTPVRMTDTLRIVGFDYVFAVVVAAALIFWVQPQLQNWAALPALMAITVLVALAYVVRIATSAELRGEVGRVLTRTWNKLAPKKP